jgi:hypothetical protein
MKPLKSNSNSGRWLRGATLALALGAGVLALASPAQAYWRGGGCCWGPHMVIGIDPFPPPPPVYYYPPPAVYYASPPVVVAPPAPTVVQAAPTCTSGQWRQQDGSVVNGVACRQPNGTWQLAN